MKENTNEKSLVKVNENSIFYKIKSFFKNFFHKDKEIENNIPIETISNENIVKNENSKFAFVENLKKIEDEDTLLLKLQKKYRSGEIKEEDLTEEQKNSLCSLYDKQIADLKKSNEIRKNKLLQYKKKLQTEN
ncbi:MAG: hypothetical protein IKG42_07195 [Clostridia bacterium]|nr:hypothetical protein [Clostridia bacterium]